MISNAIKQRKAWAPASLCAGLRWAAAAADAREQASHGPWAVGQSDMGHGRDITRSGGSASEAHGTARRARRYGGGGNARRWRAWRAGACMGTHITHRCRELACMQDGGSEGGPRAPSRLLNQSLEPQAECRRPPLAQPGIGMQTRQAAGPQAESSSFCPWPQGGSGFPRCRAKGRHAARAGGLRPCARGRQVCKFEGCSQNSTPASTLRWPSPALGEPLENRRVSLPPAQASSPRLAPAWVSSALCAARGCMRCSCGLATWQPLLGLVRRSVLETLILT